jgi:hypothetical protein
MLVSMKAAEGKPTPLFKGLVFLLLALNVFPLAGILLLFFPQPLENFTFYPEIIGIYPLLIGIVVAVANIPLLAYMLFRDVSPKWKVVYGAIIVASIGYLIYVANNADHIQYLWSLLRS